MKLQTKRRLGPTANGVPSRKKRKTKLLFRYYNRLGDLATLRKIAREEQGRLVGLIARGFVDRLERERRPA